MSEIYWNSHKKLFSVRNKGLVTDHVSSGFMKKPEFVVQPAGREKVLKTGQKNVHAFIRGEVLEANKENRTWFSVEDRDVSDFSFAVYNPQDESGCFRILCVVGEFIIRNKVRDMISGLHFYIHDGKPQLKVKIT
jgi:hypothetical protein